MLSNVSCNFFFLVNVVQCVARRGGNSEGSGTVGGWVWGRGREREAWPWCGVWV